MTEFFKKFPTINYANTTAKNLMARVNFTQLALNTRRAYYTYDVEEGERVDTISYNYYDNADFFWLISLANQTIDPYYDFPISYDDVNTMLVKKYGSVQAASRKILYFTNNWLTDDSNISTAAYDSLPGGKEFQDTPWDSTSLSTNLKKYWAPDIGSNGKIIGYVRKQEDWVITTNKTVQCTLSSNAAFTVGERIIQSSNVIATVEYSSGTTLIVKHVDDTIALTTITGEDSAVTATVSAVNTLVQNIPDAEMIYWSPVTAFDHEHGLNQAKRNIKLLDNRSAQQATTELKRLLK